MLSGAAPLMLRSLCFTLAVLAPLASSNQANSSLDTAMDVSHPWRVRHSLRTRSGARFGRPPAALRRVASKRRLVNATTAALSKATNATISHAPKVGLPASTNHMFSQMRKEEPEASPFETAAPAPEAVPSETATPAPQAAAPAAAPSAAATGTLEVNGPLPDDFNHRFQQAVAYAVNVSASEVEILSTQPVNDDGTYVEVTFSAPDEAVQSVLDQASDPDSPLANSALHRYLVEEEGNYEAPAEDGEGETAGVTPSEGGLDVDTEVPYGELAPFGREDTAKELTDQSITESNEMVDQFERAEVAEEKRSVFRALTRLRGAAITSFDGIARDQTGNIDTYNDGHRWRNAHPLKHLAQEESDISDWAFPEQST